METTLQKIIGNKYVCWYYKVDNIKDVIDVVSVYSYFLQNNIKFRTVDKTVLNQLVVCTGSTYQEFIINNQDSNSLLIGPTTVNSSDETFVKSLNNRCTVLAQDSESFLYSRKRCGKNTMLCKSVLNNTVVSVKKKKGDGTVKIFSVTELHGIRTVKQCLSELNKYMIMLNRYETIETDIVHISVLGNILGKNIILKDNISYYSYYLLNNTNITHMNSSSFMSFMIVYDSDKNRTENYKIQSAKLNYCINKFTAVDTVRKHSLYREYALKNNYCTEEYIKSYGNYVGKLGCNLSHQILLQNIKKNNFYGKKWFLILEDDVDITGCTINEIESWISLLDTVKSKFAQLYTNDKFKDKQFSMKPVTDNVYKMVAQWGTVAYLISDEGVEYVLSKFPISSNIDCFYSRNITHLSSTCIKNSFINTLGSTSISDKNKLGSIIWDSVKK